MLCNGATAARSFVAWTSGGAGKVHGLSYLAHLIIQSIFISDTAYTDSLPIIVLRSSTLDSIKRSSLHVSATIWQGAERWSNIRCLLIPVESTFLVSSAYLCLPTSWCSAAMNLCCRGIPSQFITELKNCSRPFRPTFEMFCQTISARHLWLRVEGNLGCCNHSDVRVLAVLRPGQDWPRIYSSMQSTVFDYRFLRIWCTVPICFGALCRSRCDVALLLSTTAWACSWCKTEKKRERLTSLTRTTRQIGLPSLTPGGRRTGMNATSRATRQDELKEYNQCYWAVIYSIPDRGQFSEVTPPPPQIVAWMLGTVQ